MLTKKVNTLEILEMEKESPKGFEPSNNGQGFFFQCIER